LRVPPFLVRRFYVAGSLRNTPSGFSLQAHNELGDGMLVGVRRISVDGTPVPLDAVRAERDGSGETLRAADISRTQPIPVRRGERVTLVVEGQHLSAGDHALEVDLIERDLGGLELAITEAVAPEGVDDQRD
jgi:hypothetical protein